MVAPKMVLRKSFQESKTLWHIAAPAIIAMVSLQSIGLVTTAFAGHIGSVELAAVALSTGTINQFAYALMLGMASALETLCGQAVGAGRLDMLGVYMQRSWVLCGGTALTMVPLFVFTAPVLKLIHQNPEVSDAAAKYTPWLIPQLLAYAVVFPQQKFLQAQSKVWVMAAISAAALGLHVLLNWALVSKLHLGLIGAAMAGNITWWFVCIAQFVYIACGFFPQAWTGLSTLAFKNLPSFCKLSVASGLMLCLEIWYYIVVNLLVGWLKNPELAIGAMAICTNYSLWTMMITMGFNVAASVRVANELGANQPKVARFSVIVAVLTSIAVGLVFAASVVVFRQVIAAPFTHDPALRKEVTDMAFLLSALILLNSIHPVLCGVAIGAGWQSTVAFVNLGCYYFIGLPVDIVLGFKLKLREKGIWEGLIAGALAQTAILIIITARTKWQLQASQAADRIKHWGEDGRSVAPDPQA